MGINGRLEIGAGAIALPGSLLLLERTQTLIAADVHFGYEDAIGAALPLWSTARSRDALLAAARETSARELVLLGDVIHTDRLSEGAAREVGAAIEALREALDVVLVAGNHEGRTRGARVLGETVESVERDGWMLVHGDRPFATASRRIAGHLHPSLPLARGESVPVFLASASTIVVPAVTPYSRGLNVLGEDCAVALAAYGVRAPQVTVVASAPDRVYAFGKLDALRDALRERPHPRDRYRRSR